mgnify:CR=1 FL=1
MVQALGLLRFSVGSRSIDMFGTPWACWRTMSEVEGIHCASLGASESSGFGCIEGLRNSGFGFCVESGGPGMFWTLWACWLKKSEVKGIHGASLGALESSGVGCIDGFGELTLMGHALGGRRRRLCHRRCGVVVSSRSCGNLGTNSLSRSKRAATPECTSLRVVGDTRMGVKADDTIVGAVVAAWWQGLRRNMDVDDDAVA